MWTEQTFDKLVNGDPEPLPSRMRVTNAMLVNVLAREEDAFPVMRRLVEENHEDRRTQLRLARRALRLTRSLVHSGVVTRLARALHQAEGRPSPQLGETTVKNTLAAVTTPSLLHPGVLAYYRQAGIGP